MTPKMFDFTLTFGGRDPFDNSPPHSNQIAEYPPFIRQPRTPQSPHKNRHKHKKARISPGPTFMLLRVIRDVFNQFFCIFPA